MKPILNYTLIMLLMLGGIQSFAQNGKAAENDKEIKKKLTRYEETDLRQQGEFLAAVQSGNLEEAKAKFKAHYFYAFDDGGENAFTRAIKNKDLDMIEFLEEKAVINLANQAGEIPLILALESGDEKVIDLVMERASPSLQDEAGRSPVMVVLEMGDLVMLRELIEKGAELNEKSQGLTPIFRAVALNNMDAVAMLAHHGADPSIANEEGEIPLYYAVRSGQNVMTGILLHKSSQPQVDANWRNPEGEPLLNLSIKDNQDQITKMLLDFGADIHRTDYLENTPLNLAAEQGDPALVKILLALGADPNHRNMMGETPILSAAREGHGAVADILAQAGADAGAQDYNGLTATDRHNFGDLTDPEIVDAVMEVSNNNSSDY
jgi:ankyrin repeat protein